jgi:hypothetical protein
MNVPPNIAARSGQIIAGRYVNPTDNPFPSVVVVNTIGVIGPVGAIRI